MSKKKPRRDFIALNERLASDVVEKLGRASRHSAVIVEAPPGAGKSTLTVSVAKSLIDQDASLPLAIVTQTNEQADDLVVSFAKRYPGLEVARMVGGDGPSGAIENLVADDGSVQVVKQTDDIPRGGARIVVSTARKWQYERSRRQKAGRLPAYPVALIDEAYQMRSDMLLGIADLCETLLCVGDPGQLDPFTIIDDSIWKGLPYSPSRSALATLRAFHPDIAPIQMPTSWRLPPSAAGIVSSAFYPFSGFEAGTEQGDRRLELGKPRRKAAPATVDVDAVLGRAAKTGWAYVELPERFTVRTDQEMALVIAELVARLVGNGATVFDERHRAGRPLAPSGVAVVTAHNDQVHWIRYALSKAGLDLNDIVVSTANKIQGREYDVVFVWHPLSGRRDATAFHLEAGRMCVMLSRHRQACVVVGRAGAARLLEEFPDSDPMFLDEPEKFPDGWEANYLVLQHLASCRTA